MKTIELGDLHKYEYSISDISAKFNYEQGDTYTCMQTGRRKSGLMYLYHLNTTHYFEDKALNLMEGDFCYFPAGIRYRSVFTKCAEGKRNAIIINFALTDSKGEEFILSDDIIFISSLIGKDYSSLMERIADTISSNSPVMLIKARLYELLTDISISVGTHTAAPEYRKILAGLEFIERNYDKSITVANAAKESFMSESHFRRMFKKHIHKTPLEYINELRIEKATSMLKSGMYKASEISKAIGIDNPAYFSWFYKNKTGISPSEFED